MPKRLNPNSRCRPGSEIGFATQQREVQTLDIVGFCSMNAGGCGAAVLGYVGRCSAPPGAAFAFSLCVFDLSGQLSSTAIKPLKVRYLT